MKKIEICLSPELIHLHDLKGKIVVVVDIFRATSTMVTGLANAVQSITPVAGLETCRAMKKEGYIIAGERNGQTAEGFELGNSPLSYLKKAYEGKKIAVTTTNGTLAIELSKKDADEVILGAFLNLQATADYLVQKNKDVVIHCAGWKGMFNLEDSLYAGALVKRLAGHFTFDCDGAIAMKSLFEQHQNNLQGFLNQASHAKRLQNHNIEADIDFCLTMDKYDLVGKLQGEALIKVNPQKETT
ncbi:2-phosphosulfolactate phosphatase [Echinicola jeungdonensis]|uniref:Probable 2-phosphosulfolactate phosphatase n=1 Tax=Echinicola jeungdonensis TaxID=709343 RepID=A0ABV5J3M2_9BACT|nr:2-phosphosulfolactate phosphatase [Echinicola jeungdonensis]MDN3668198.1 2-phosphosulfolactate phosphatase [Echinicola jeungdonensis]MDN3671222.1 2-phosphosulfolactate phosphatase [Echinicola jeungdonensis]MDN3671239.1 2-phosphosulfolactate phosphatase [Echinicola jeungdonensis]